MTRFRSILFWTHLVCGLVCGVVIFIMSFTGAALALQPQILLWLEQDTRTVAVPASAAWLEPEALIARVADARPGLTPTGITREHDPAQAVAVTLTEPVPPGENDRPQAGRRRAPQTTVYANPYTGEILGELEPTEGARRFFRVMTDWHRWLAMSGEGRTTGRWITGVSNAAFLLLGLTGLYIWVPRVWTWAALRAVTLFRANVSGKARDFNWHNVIGVWSVPVLVVLTFTGMCISFPTTYDVIYAVTGIERPSSPSRRGEAREGRRARSTADEASASASGASADSPEAISLDEAWSLAEARMPSWRSIALRMGADSAEPLTFTLTDRDSLSRVARSTLIIDRATGDVVRWEPYDGLAVGQRLRTWMRFGHTGELWGLPGQAVAGLASAGGCVLVYTGFALAWRRFRAWRTRRSRRFDIREQPAA